MGIPTLEECNPGIMPMEYNVVIAPEIVEDRIGSILLPEQTKETQGLATQKGRLVAVSPVAFTYADWPDGSRKPEVGDAVLFAKYGGGLFKGADGKEVRVLKDKDVIAVLTA